MRPSLPSLDIENLPGPADPGLAALGMTRWREVADEIDDAEVADFMRALADHASGTRLLASLFGNSPFLTQCSLREPGFLMRLVQRGPDATFAEVEAALNVDLAEDRDRANLMRRLRVAKRRAALVAALADIAGWWSLERVTSALVGDRRSGAERRRAAPPAGGGGAWRARAAASRRSRARERP